MSENTSSEIVATATPTAEVAATTPEVKTPATPVKESRRELREKLQKSAEEMFAKGKQAPVVVPATETPNPESVPETVAKLEEALGEEAAKKPGETKAQYELKISKLLMQMQRAEANGLKYKTDFEKTSAELTELKAKFAEASSDPVKALKLANMTPDQLAQAMIDGTLSKSEEKVAKQELAPEVLEIIEEHKRLKAEKLEREEAAKADEQRTKNVKIVDDAKNAVLDRFPTLELIPSDRLFDAYSQITKAQDGEEPAFDDFAEKMQANIISELANGVGHRGTLKAILAAKPELKAFLLAELGVGTAPPVVVQGVQTPRSLTTAATSESPTKGKEPTAKERAQLAKALAERMFDRSKA